MTELKNPNKLMDNFWYLVMLHICYDLGRNPDYLKISFFFIILALHLIGVFLDIKKTKLKNLHDQIKRESKYIDSLEVNNK